MRWMTLLLATTLMGCATNRITILKTEVAGLEAEIVELKDDRTHLCAITVEMATNGMAQYIGGINFRHAWSGEIVEIEELHTTCATDLLKYKEEVKKRAQQE